MNLHRMEIARVKDERNVKRTKELSERLDYVLEKLKMVRSDQS